jgi:hypothetical protein
LKQKHEVFSGVIREEFQETLGVKPGIGGVFDGYAKKVVAKGNATTVLVGNSALDVLKRLIGARNGLCLCLKT